MSQPLDAIDTIATRAFEGYVVRKDLVRKFKGQYPVPTYVAEFLLGRYCASVDEEEIAEGLKIVERQLGEKTIRAGEHELFKARAKEKGHVKLIDIITARLDAASDSFLATLPSLQLKDVRIGEAMVHGNERMLTGGFYAEVELAYDPTIAQEKNGRPFGIDSLREIQLSKREVLPALYQGREAFAMAEWQHFLIRSIGMEPEQLSPRAPT
jgi:ATP-dependent Lon protease